VTLEGFPALIITFFTRRVLRQEFFPAGLIIFSAGSFVRVIVDKVFEALPVLFTTVWSFTFTVSSSSFTFLIITESILEGFPALIITFFTRRVLRQEFFPAGLIIFSAG
jgi:hypothetical protein